MTDTPERTNGPDDDTLAIGTICIFAAFADGDKQDAERERLRGIFDGLGAAALADAYQRVLLKRTTLEAEVARLSSRETRQLAYEMAVCVCDADGVATAAERAFLDELRRGLGLDAAAATAVREEADALAATVEVLPPIEPPPARPAPAASPSPVEAELDAMILNHAILAGGLELLPQSVAGLAILPLQMKLVYGIGARHGVQLDRRQVTELLGALGIGMTGQLVENFARKLLGGLFRKTAGKAAGKLASAAAGAGTTFVTTYALGQVARAYYGRGRSIDTAELRRLFSEKSSEAQGLFQQYRGDIEARSRNLDVQQLLPLLKGR